MNQPQTEYRSAHGFALALVVMLAVNVVTTILTGVGIALYFYIINSGADSTIALYGSTLVLLGGVSVFLFVAEAVVMLIWMHRAYANLQAFGVQYLNYSPGWAIGAWFVPILNLFRPLQIISEIWNNSDPEKAGTDSNFGDATIPGLFGVWWGLRLIGGISERIEAAYSRRADGLDETSYALSLISTAAIAVSLILLIKIVWAIDRRQQAAARKLDLRQGVLPPPPPQF